jgi:bacteriocin-like protein
MQTMTYNEMRQVEGGRELLCAASAIGWAAAEYGIISGFATGGIGFGIAVIGMAAGLYGMMASC